MRRLCLALLVAGGLFQTSSANAVILDSFTGPPPVSITATHPAPNPVATGNLPIVGALGGIRNNSVFIDTNLGAANPQASLGTGAGQASFSANDNIAGIFTLTWPNLAGLIQNPVSFDFNILTNDNGGTFTLEITGGATATEDLVVGAGATGARSIGINGATFPGVNLNAITQIRLIFDGNVATDLSISPITITTDGKVPEPSTFVIAALFAGLLVGGMYLRRRSAKLVANLA